MPDDALPIPRTPRQPVADLLHGVRVEDPYRWLEDPTTPDTRAWVDAQNDRARAALAELTGRDRLARRFAELFYVDAVSAPHHRGDRYFYTRRHKSQEKSIVYWREGDGPEHVLIDPNTLSEDGSVSLGGWYPSEDGQKVAYKLKENNADESTMHVRDVASGEDSPVDVIIGAKYADARWLADGSGFFYTWLPTDPAIPVADRPGYAEVRFHRLGTPAASDPVVFPATGSPRTFIGPSVSRDGRWLAVYIQHGWNATDIWFKDLTAPDAASPDAPVDPEAVKTLSTAEWIATNARAHGFAPLMVGVEALAEVDFHAGVFYLMTNDGAPRYRVFAVDPANVARDAWREIVPEVDATLESARVMGGHLVLRYLDAASSKLEVRRLDGAFVRRVPLPGIGTVDGVVGTEDDDAAWFSFSSFTRPPEIYQTSIADGGAALWAKVEMPVDTSGFVVEQVWYPSRDGTPISMFIVSKKGTPRNGDNPTLLYGYGGFNVSLTPSYASSVVIWLEQGGVYAVPNLRGGAEYGEAWHQAGMGASKQNVFDDFIGAAEYLIAEGWTRPERLAIRGGSNGGLLVGAAMTQRPDLFGAVICAVPLLDMVRYHLFGSGKTWIPEYGSADDPAEFATLLRYSPYHNVSRGVRYPALLMAAADSDDRVDPMHARKFTAAIQWASASARPVLMRVEKNAGHGGADLVQKTVESYADQWAFLLWQIGRD
ncbi:MAG: S9 family peptidase [Deltaproteobacteria bacterium]|nr:MAG: S9 family peptidase [Deltaproteobacteria bacterium]